MLNDLQVKTELPSSKKWYGSWTNNLCLRNRWRTGLIAERFLVVQILHNAESY